MKEWRTSPGSHLLAYSSGGGGGQARALVVGGILQNWVSQLSCSAMAAVSSAAADRQQSQRLGRIKSSKLYQPDPRNKLSLIYSASYNIAFRGLEKLHPFDSSKWGRIVDLLTKNGSLDRKKIVEPNEATEEDLLVVHTKRYLQSLNWSAKVAMIIEVAPVGLLPNFIVQRKVLRPFRKQVGGTVLAAKLAVERGWAVNLGGGFHHCSANQGGGFCAYADISLCLQFAFSELSISRAMIIDLDAHQGNGHERDCAGDERVYILDMYNCEIYPQDVEAKRWINQRVELHCGTTTEIYLQRLEEALKVAQSSFEPQLLIYNAGTDILAGDPLGNMLVSPEGVRKRDEMVFRFAKEQNIPIVMLTSGGYMKTSAEAIADSMINLSEKSLISLGSQT